MGVGLLREIYIKTNNFIGGRYFAEIIKQVMKELEDQKYVMAELRLSVYGVKYSEFTELAKWAIEQKVSAYGLESNRQATVRESIGPSLDGPFCSPNSS